MAVDQTPHDHPHHPVHSPVHQLRALVNKEGGVNVHGTRDRRNPFNDLYHFFFSLSWPRFFVVVGSLYIFLNLCFGTVYFINGVDPQEHAQGWQRFSHCFFLSVENLTSVDYSKVENPDAVVCVLMTVQAFLGLLTLAVMTGLFYARFSRPTARVIFSSKAIIANHNGKPCLFFRIANERLNQIAEAHIGLHMTRSEISLEGEQSRKFYEMKLERDYSPLFALSWTVRHYINEHSPLFGLDKEKMHAAEMGLVTSLTGTDETFGQPIIARHAYSSEDIVYNKRFKDIITFHERKVHIDLKSIHEFYDMELAVKEV